MSTTINVTDFSKFPGPRYRNLGEYSGEAFREDILVPAISKYGEDLIVNLDGTMGYGSSFLEESFGGLIRTNHISAKIITKIVDNLVSDEDPSLKLEIREYVGDAS
jgi:hypothetical protein